MNRLRLLAPLALAPLAAACGGGTHAATPAAPTATTVRAPQPPVITNPATKPYAALTRDAFNRLAVHENLPVYWIADANGDGTIDPSEVAALLFYPTQGDWVKDGRFTPAFDAAYQSIVKAQSQQPTGTPEEITRKNLVLEDLDQGFPTLVRSDLRGLTEHEKAFVRHVLDATHLVDQLYATQNGSAAVAKDVPADDAASQSLFRRNWGPACLEPKTEGDPRCSAIPNAPKPIVDVYPADMQKDAHFCEALEKRPDAKSLLGPFTVVRSQNGKLVAVADAVAYADTMKGISTALTAAAGELAAAPELHEQPLVDYLNAAAGSFTTNDWLPADEAWAKMNATNSKWYLRIGPDETYWEPCSHKAAFHVTFARINPDSLAWQNKLAPVEQDMEQSLATLIGKPYAARKVTFHLPDFIDIVWNAGGDRDAFGATVGQSLPNWGKVANEGRGRTVAMSNLYTDSDSLAIRRDQASTVLTGPTLAEYDVAQVPSLLTTILHEATHNLGPAHEYAYQGKTDDDAFGGGLASMLEELKSETGALYFIEFARARGLIDDALAKKAYAAAIVWGFGHISRGMWTARHDRKAYGQLAAIQTGFLMDEGALTWDPDATAANGHDKGAFTIHFDKLPAASEKMMKVVGLIKAANDKAGALKLSDRYVDGDVVPQKIIAERYLRAPRASFVYAVDM